MANTNAIQLGCEGVVRLLRLVYNIDQAQANPVLPNQLKFGVHLAKNFKTGDTDFISKGVSLFLYRVYVNANQRAARSQDLSGKYFRPPLPVELHFFLTVWASSASEQHQILGWTMRTLEDYPILPAVILNSSAKAFNDDETVEIIPGQLTNEEMMRIWDDLDGGYQISVPYIARIIRIESKVEVQEGGKPVMERLFEMMTPSE